MRLALHRRRRRRRPAIAANKRKKRVLNYGRGAPDPFVHGVLFTPDGVAFVRLEAT